MSIYDDDDEGFGTPYPAGRAKRRLTSPLPRKNMTTREILEYYLDGYDEDMEPLHPKFRQTQMPDPELEFDGQDLYVKRNNIVQNSWPAMSGQPGYQNRASTSVSNLGPTPEGVYYVDPQNLQERIPWNDRVLKAISDDNIPIKDIPAYLFKKGTYKWMRDEKLPAWGNYRVPLEADDGTDTRGRHSMYIHGGDELGSAGCIDVGPNMDRLAPYIKNNRSSVKVLVRYKDEDFER